MEESLFPCVYRTVLSIFNDRPEVAESDPNLNFEDGEKSRHILSIIKKKELPKFYN